MTPGQALNVLRQMNGPPSEMTKEAAFLYRLTGEERAREALGRPFVKFAQLIERDPWALAHEVVGGLPRMKLATANPEQQRLVHFYELWANNLEKRALSLQPVINAGRRLLSPGVGQAMAKSTQAATAAAPRSAEIAAQRAAAVRNPGDAAAARIQRNLVSARTRSATAAAPKPMPLPEPKITAAPAATAQPAAAGLTRGQKVVGGLALGGLGAGAGYKLMQPPAQPGGMG